MICLKKTRKTPTTPVELATAETDNRNGTTSALVTDPKASIESEQILGNNNKSVIPTILGSTDLKAKTLVHEQMDIKVQNTQAKCMDPLPSGVTEDPPPPGVTMNMIIQDALANQRANLLKSDEKFARARQRESNLLGKAEKAARAQAQIEGTKPCASMDAITNDLESKGNENGEIGSDDDTCTDTEDIHHQDESFTGIAKTHYESDIFNTCNALDEKGKLSGPNGTVANQIVTLFQSTVNEKIGKLDEELQADIRDKVQEALMNVFMGSIVKHEAHYEHYQIDSGRRDKSFDNMEHQKLQPSMRKVEMMNAFPEYCISRVVKTDQELGESFDEFTLRGMSKTGVRIHVKDIAGLEADELVARVLQGMSPKLAMEETFHMRNGGTMLHRLLGEPLCNYYLLNCY